MDSAISGSVIQVAGMFFALFISALNRAGAQTRELRSMLSSTGTSRRA